MDEHQLPGLIRQPKPNAAFLIKALPPTVIQAVVTSVISRQDELPATLRNRLRQAIQDTLRIHGFRRAWQAPAAHLIPAVCAAVVQRLAMPGPIVAAWLHLHDAACQAVLAADTTDIGTGLWDLETRTEDPSEVEAQTIEDTLGKEADHAEQDLSTRFALLFDNSDRPFHADASISYRDWLLALLWLKRPKETDETEDATTPTPEEPHSMIWTEWLETLRGLEPEAPEWGQIEEFTKAILELAQQKRADRSRVRELAAALDQLRNVDAALLAYFEFGDLMDWQADSRDLADDVLDRLIHLQAHLAEFAALQVLAQQPTTISESRERQVQLWQVEDAIVKLRDELTAYFEAQPNPSASTSPPNQHENAAVETLHRPPVAALDSAEPKSEATLKPETVLEKTAPSESEWDMEPKPALEETAPPTSELAAEVDPDLTSEESVHSSINMLAAEETALDIANAPQALVDVHQEGESGVQTQLEMTDASEADQPEDSAKIIQPALTSTTSDVHPTDSLPQEPASQTMPDASPLAMSPEDMEPELIYRLIENDDLAGAYWAARSFEAQGITPPVAPALLAALQGGRWISGKTMHLADGLLSITHDVEFSTGQIEEQLFAVAAALQPTILAPSSGLVAWLSLPGMATWLTSLTEPVLEFARYGTGLMPERIPGLTNITQLQEALEETAQEAREWLAAAPARRSQLKRAVDVWLAMVGPQGVLLDFMQPVANNQVPAAQDVRATLDTWTSDRVDRFIHDTDRQLSGANKRPIDGKVRDYLQRNVDEALHLAGRWCDFAEQMLVDRTGSDWLIKQAMTLRDGLREALPGVDSALAELSSPTQPTGLRAAAAALMCAINEVSQILGLEIATPMPVVAEKATAWYTRGTMSLQESLNRRLLWLPEIELEDSGTPQAEALPNVAACLILAQSRSLEEVVEEWVAPSRQDYRFVESLLPLLPDPEAKRMWIADMRDGSRAALREKVSKTLDFIEQAVVDGIIGDDKRAEAQSEVAMLDGDQIQHFGRVFARMDEIQMQIEAERAKRLQMLEKDWRELQEKLDSSPIPVATQKLVHERISSALTQKDTRLMEEGLSHLRNALETGEDLSENPWYVHRVNADVLQRFIERQPELEQISNLSNVVRSINEGRSVAGLQFGGIPSAQRKEAATALKAWMDLKQKPGANGQEKMLSALATYLGFTLEQGSPMTLVRSGDDWRYWTVRMSASDLARPIAQFGSTTQGLYHVVCFWDRPGTVAIAARLDELRLSDNSLLVLYFGRLTTRQRRDLAQTCRNKKLALAVLDESLAIFLAAERDARLPTFLRCALPFAQLSPYVPFLAGNVPPEMFYGREEMVRALMDQQGSCIVYGGRQLGKSALLRQVQRRFHDPEQRQYASFVDIKLVGDPYGTPDTDQLWYEIRDGLKQHGLISDRITTGKPPEIMKQVRQVLDSESKNARRILFLFDEADNFLDADAKENFRVVEQLRTLMAETDRRFKVIFAGLHNVQRFQGMPNQPLAHFGDPLSVGPLTPGDALALVREPLEVLGFRFDSEQSALRVLSYTNYHPSLLQLFCQELLSRLYRMPATLPPFSITQEDVEAIYRNEDVRRPIRDRFDWTLALDRRYQAIAWALVVEQMAERDSYARAYSPSQILQFVQSWWPKGFLEQTPFSFQGLLEELIGLGVLVRSSEGRYRLRSPNLVRLMGSEQEIENHLLELSSKDAPAEYSADQYHAPLNSDRTSYSPLSYAQERLLNRPASGVSLIFASEALGWGKLADAIRSFGTRGSQEEAWEIEPISLVHLTPAKLEVWLQDYLDRRGDHAHLFAYARLAGIESNKAQALVEAAQAFCEKRRSQRRRLRVFFLFNAKSSWLWLAGDPVQRAAVEGMVDAMVSPSTWRTEGIRQRLHQLDKMSSEEVCQEILACTGGWPYLLDKLLHRAKGEDDLRRAARMLHAEIMEGNGSLRREFIEATGAPADKVPGRVLATFHGLVAQSPDEFVPEGIISPADIGGAPPLTNQTFQAALTYLVRLSCLQQTNSMGEGISYRLDPYLARLPLMA